MMMIMRCSFLSHFHFSLLIAEKRQFIMQLVGSCEMFHCNCCTIAQTPPYTFFSRILVYFDSALSVTISNFISFVVISNIRLYVLHCCHNRNSLVSNKIYIGLSRPSTTSSRQICYQNRTNCACACTHRIRSIKFLALVKTVFADVVTNRHRLTESIHFITLNIS